MKKEEKNKIDFFFKIRKELGQNFINDEDYLKKIINSLKIKDNSMIIEVGTGYGKMTKILKEKINCGRLISIEKDKNLFEFNKKKNIKNIEFINDDVLNFNWEKLISSEKYNYSSIIVLGNLPYNISNSLIINLLKKRQLFDEFIFLVQKEVGERWSAYEIEKYSKKRGFSSAFIKFCCKIEIIIDKVPKEKFYPIPKVNGMLLRLKIIKKNKDNKWQEEWRLINFFKEIFFFRRKMIFKKLINQYKDKEKEIYNFFSKKNIDKKIRIQEMDLKDIIDLFFILKKGNW